MEEMLTFFYLSNSDDFSKSMRARVNVRALSSQWYSMFLTIKKLKWEKQNMLRLADKRHLKNKINTVDWNKYAHFAVASPSTFFWLVRTNFDLLIVLIYCFVFFFSSILGRSAIRDFGAVRELPKPEEAGEEDEEEGEEEEGGTCCPIVLPLLSPHDESRHFLRSGGLSDVFQTEATTLGYCSGAAGPLRRHGRIQIPQRRPAHLQTRLPVSTVFRAFRTFSSAAAAAGQRSFANEYFFLLKANIEWHYFNLPSNNSTGERDLIRKRSILTIMVEPLYLPIRFSDRLTYIYIYIYF